MSEATKRIEMLKQNRIGKHNRRVNVEDIRKKTRRSQFEENTKCCNGECDCHMLVGGSGTPCPNCLETKEILSNPKTMAGIKQSMKEIEEGKTHPLSELHKNTQTGEEDG